MSEHGIPERADAVVIGAGALGAATAFHLAKAGLFVALLDKAELASQAPASCWPQRPAPLRPDDDGIAARGVEKIVNFQAETGEPIVFFQPGSLKIARRPEHEAQLHEEVARGEQLGLDVAMIALDEARRLMPYLVTEGVRAVMHMRTDVYLEPVQVPLGYSRASSRLGAALAPNTPVEEIPHGGRLRRRCAHVSRGDPSAYRGRRGRRVAPPSGCAGRIDGEGCADPAPADGDGSATESAAEPADNANHRRQRLRAAREGRPDARRILVRSSAVRHARSASRFSYR